MAANRRNKLVVPQARQAIEQMKNEIAAELGVENYDQVDKGALPARFHGAVGGTITKRLIELGQEALANGTASANIDPSEVNQYKQHMVQDLQH